MNLESEQMIDTKSAAKSLIRQIPVKQVNLISVSDALNKVTCISVQAALRAYDGSENPDKKTSTTLRLPNGVAEFYSVLAKDLGISLQNAIVISLVGLIETERANSVLTDSTR